MTKLLRIQVTTLGCSKNRVDSEHLLRQLQAAGMEISPEGEDLTLGKVNILVLNTCGFIKDAKEESIEAILAGVQAKAQGYISKILVFGCLSQRYGKELSLEIPEVDRFLGACDIDGLLEELSLKRSVLLDTERVLTTPPHFAYLKIAEGCDRRCSYCAIPAIRGRHISTPMEDLVKEAAFLADSGVKELILVAQDTTFYGLDLYKKRMLGQLLEKLIEINGIQWLRIHYSYPDSFPDDVLEIMAASSKICKYMDIPLQHSSDKVLKNMRRSITGADTRALVEKMRKSVPGIVLRTTMIVGHPGEGESEFEDLLDFIRDYRFERLGAFTYSEEEGTWGAENLKDDVPEKVKGERYDELMEVQADISLDFNYSRIGSVERVLIDSFSEDGVLVGRTSKESPEVDGEVLVDSASLGEECARNMIGDFFDVKIENADDYDLMGRLL